MRKRKILLIVSMLVHTGLTSCTGVASFDWSNDIVGGTDQNFTNRVRFQHNSEVEKTPKLVQDAYNLIPAFAFSKDDPKELKRVVQTVENNMYTPDDLRSSAIVKNDVPYSGLTEVKAKRINDSDTKRIATEVSLGITGKQSGTEFLQKFVHNDLRAGTDPKGWDNQMSTEPTVNLNHTREWENSRDKLGRIDFVSLGYTNYRLGTVHTDLELAHGWKIGYNVDNLSGKNKDFSCFLSGYGYIRGVARNLHYDGTLFRDSVYTVNSAPVVGSINVAPEINWKNYVIRFDYNIRSKDYLEQRSGTHTFGILSFGTIW